MASKTVFAGMRYVNLLRCSTHLKDTSPEDQKAANDRYAAKLGMIHAGDVTLKGVSGSKTFNRRDLIDLAERRRVYKNYDVIIVYDSSRLTRGGARHSFSIKHNFAKLGVVIVSVMDPVPEGDFKDVIEAVIATQNLAYAKKTAGFVTRGMRDAVKNGVIERHGNVPIGIDRLYYGINGEPKLRLRMLSMGRRQLIDEKTNELVREMKREEGGTALYLLQDGETSKLAMGEGRIVEALREAFSLRYRDGYGFARVARHLAQRGVYPTRATKWSESTIRTMLINPIYLGWSYAFQSKCGLHYNTAENGPEERDIDQAKLEEDGRKDVPSERRPISEMRRVEHQGLSGFLIEGDVRAAAEKAIHDFYFDWHLRKQRKAVRNSNSQPHTSYILRGAMRSKQYGTSYNGRTHGRLNNQRDYRCARRIEAHPPAIPCFNCIRAEPVEKAVLQVVRAAFQNISGLHDRVSAGVANALSELPSEIECEHLQRELEENNARFIQIQRSFTAKELQDNEETIVEMRRRKRELEARIAASKPNVSLDAAELSLAVMKSLNELDRGVDPSCFEKVRLLIKILCPSIVVDMETLEVEVQVALPTSILMGRSLEQALMGDPCTGFESRAGVTQRLHCVEIGLFRLTPLIIGPPKRAKAFPAFKEYAVTPIGSPVAA